MIPFFRILLNDFLSFRSVFSSIAYWSMLRVRPMVISCHFYIFMVLGALAGVPYLGGRPTGWSFKYIKAWDSTLVHPAEVDLPVSNLIHCLFFSNLYTQQGPWIYTPRSRVTLLFKYSIFPPLTLLLTSYKGDRTSIQCHVLCPVLHIMTFEMWPPMWLICMQ